MPEVIFNEKKDNFNLSSGKGGIARRIADYSGGMLTEQGAAILIVVVSFFLIIFSTFIFIKGRPDVDTQRNFRPAVMEEDNAPQ